MILEVKNLVKKYGDMVAVDHLNLQIEEGDIFGLLGPNGSGKTTTINCVLSLLKYSEGDIRIFDKEMKPSAYDIKRDIGVVMQNVAVFNELTVYENIDYFCGLYVKDKKERKELVMEAIDFVGLRDFVKFYPKKLSGGLLRRLNIACGIAHKPKLIILDEPTVAVDPQSRNNILEGIEKLNKAGATIIYTSHYMEEVDQLCNKLVVMDKGKIIAAGTKDEIKDMASTGEKVTVELKGDSDAVSIAAKVSELEVVKSAKYEGKTIHIKTKKGEHGLMEILEFFQKNNIRIGNIFSEQPTLNDVFLQLTGKELRDNV